MSDLISRKAAIDALYKIFPANPMRNDYTEGITCGAAMATEYIKQLPSAQQWTPVTEELPKKDGAYLVTVETHRERTKEVLVLIGSYVSRFKPFHWFGSVGKVTAWAPLPEPYKGGGDE